MATVTTEVAPVQPDIGYTPDLDKYLTRVKRRLRTDPTRLENKLPDGLPSHISSDLVWEGNSIADHYQWAIELNAEQIAEIEEAVATFLQFQQGVDAPRSSGQASRFHRPRNVPVAELAFDLA